MFRRKKPIVLPDMPVTYPIGTFLQSGKKYYYVVSDTRLLEITSQRILDSWNPTRIVQTKVSVLSGYKKAGNLKFRDGTIIRDISDNKIYVIDSKKKRHVTDADFLFYMQLKEKDIPLVSTEELDRHEEGEDI